MKKKSFIFIITSFLFILGIIVGFSTSWTVVPTINISGSSAILQLVSNFSDVYDKSDIVVQSGGSGKGINDVLSDLKEIGMVSKDPKGLTDSDYESKWKNKKIKTITIAWDGIGVIYKPSSSNSDKLNINNSNIDLLYEVFSGYKEFSFSDFGIDDSTKLIPFARQGGAQSSGTTDAFLENSNLNSNLSQDVYDSIHNGSYGKYTKTTNESNSQAWSMIKNFNKPGLITYLSAGFILNNYSEIKENGFEIMNYNNFELKFENITNGYNWYRPLNLITSLVTENQSVRNFIEWICTNDLARSIVTQNGYVNLTDNQYESMKKNDIFWVSDEQLGYCGAK